MIKELINGNYYIYQLSDGGCGIVQAKGEKEAAMTVVDAYNRQHSGIYEPADVHIKEIEGKNNYHESSPNVLELGWQII